MTENRKKPIIIAGPCSAESREQVFSTAAALKKEGVDWFRAGLWKPRTHPGHFEGVGEAGLPWLAEVRDSLDMKVATEVAFREHVEKCLEAGIDTIWIGARTTSNPFLVQELADALAGTDVTVLVKNPINPDIELWMGALERFRRAGISKLGAIHRGFSSYEKVRYRNAPGWQIAIEFRSRCPEIPFFCDPSHLAGSREYIAELSQRSLDLGLDGLMIESHCDPAHALSDARQQITPEELGALIRGLHTRESDSDDSADREQMALFRKRIDEIDDRLLKALGERMALSREIGEFKKEHNISIIQTQRWEALMDKVLHEAPGYSLREDFVKSFFSIIHDASIEEQ